MLPEVSRVTPSNELIALVQYTGTIRQIAVRRPAIDHSRNHNQLESLKITHLSAMLSFVLSPHLQGCQTRNAPPPSRRNTRFLVFLFCGFYRPGFCSELHLVCMAMGMHAVLPKAHSLAFI
jgi:hypothetical protein